MKLKKDEQIAKTPCPICGCSDVTVVKRYEDHGFIVDLHNCPKCNFMGEMVVEEAKKTS